MSYNLLKGKRGIIFGALNDMSIAWKVAERCAEEGASIVLSNTEMALRMGELDALAKKINAPVVAADATSYEDLENVFVKAQELLGGKIDFVLHSIGMSPNVRKRRTYDDLDYNWLNKTLDISAISFHKMLQAAKKVDAIAEYGSVVALTYIASHRTFFGYKDIDNMMDFADKMSPLGNATALECADYCVTLFSDLTRKVTMQTLFHDGGFSNMGMSLRAMNQYSKDLGPYEDENGKIIYG